MSSFGHTVLGSWSGGKFMHFGMPLDDERLTALLRPDEQIHTMITADAYGAGGADLTVGRALSGLSRDQFHLISAVGHDFYAGERRGSKGFPRFTDPDLRGPEGYRDYLFMACEKSLERCGVDHFDLLMLHNPDRRGYTDERVWRALTDLRDEGLCSGLGLAPGPANGFALDVIGCLERFGDQIEWAMLILNPFEPWPGRLMLPACERHNVKVVARVVDFGGVFHDDVPDEDALYENDHRAFRPAGWIEDGRERLERIRPIGEAHDLTPLQLSCQWTLAQPAVEAVVPTLTQEPGAGAKPVEDKRAELAATPSQIVLSDDELATISRVGDNTGCMALKGGSPDNDGSEHPDSWPVNSDLRAIAERWSVVPDRDLAKTH